MNKKLLDAAIQVYGIAKSETETKVAVDLIRLAVAAPKPVAKPVGRPKAPVKVAPKVI